MQTVTIVTALPDRDGNYPEPFGYAHTALLARLARWAADHATDGLGFTLTPSVGGGGGWDIEAGATFTFAQVDAVDVPLVHAFAETLRAHLAQQAVVLLERDERFTLVTLPRAS